MAQQTIAAADNTGRAPNTGDGTEFGERYSSLLTKVQAMFTEVYTLLGSVTAGGIAFITGVTAGTVTASKAIVVDSSKAIAGLGNVTMADQAAFAFGTSTGTQLGTTATQKVAFYGATPVTQPSVLAAITTTQPTTTVFGFTTTAQFNNLIAAVNVLVANQKSIGLMATA